MNHIDIQAVTALFSVVGLALLLKLAGAWANYRVAALRQDLFELRDDLFSVAMHHPFLFKHAAYTRLRFKINLSIRLAHKFTISRLFVVLWVRQVAALPADCWPESLPGLTVEIQDRLKSIHQAMLFRMACHMLHIPLHLAWKLSAIAKTVSAEGVSRAKQEIRQQVEILEAQAAEESAMEIRMGRSAFAAAGR